VNRKTIILIAALFIVSYLVFFITGLPLHDLVESRIKTVVEKAGYEIEIDRLSVGLIRGIRANNVTIDRRKMDGREETSQRVIRLEQVDIDVGLLGALLGRPTIDLAVELLEGKVMGTVDVSTYTESSDKQQKRKLPKKFDVTIRLMIQELQLSRIEWTQFMPMGIDEFLTGVLRGDVRLHWLDTQFADEEGQRIELTVDRAMIPAKNVLLFNIPETHFDELSLTADARQDRLTVTAFHAKADQFEAELSGDIMINRIPSSSRLNLNARVKPLGQLKEQLDIMRGAGFGQLPQPDSDGFIVWELRGTPQQISRRLMPW